MIQVMPPTKQDMLLLFNFIDNLVFVLIWYEASKLYYVYVYQ